MDVCEVPVQDVFLEALNKLQVPRRDWGEEPLHQQVNVLILCVPPPIHFVADKETEKGK